jgi:hypothetical protein
LDADHSTAARPRELAKLLAWRRARSLLNHAQPVTKGTQLMATYDATNAQCLVYSYKDGLLSKIAHDLKHRVTRFTLRVDEQTKVIEAEIDARSLRVECVMKDGVESSNGLSDDDKKKIEDQIVADVLHADEQPMIRFTGTAVTQTRDGVRIEGTLALNQVTRPMTAIARRVNGHYEAELSIHQPAFNIKPFSAMMGTLKIKPDVVVKMVVPATAA